MRARHRYEDTVEDTSAPAIIAIAKIIVPAVVALRIIAVVTSPIFILVVIRRDCVGEGVKVRMEAKLSHQC